jgi:cytochrome P450
VRKYESEENCEFIRKRFKYFDGCTSAANTESFQLAMLWASVGNTMPAVFWLMFYLIKNPDAMEKVQAELRAECPSSCQGQAQFSQDQLNRLLYLDACITETLRLCSGSMIMRHVKEACEVTLASGESCCELALLMR